MKSIKSYKERITHIDLQCANKLLSHKARVNKYINV